ncbi:hypothetical protein RN001_013874 [Aquatica leii]|uniref:Transcriptional coactivator p15 (PC4) C-terminal domain-containing protein n=1 Tax=Aquatica leii TaxID=1421715 RepID=A0AAN7SE65_9COLE|nr:hypothetical protein RN001_013874 [Aquatica leii]
MPKTKPSKKKSESSDSDSGPEDRGPAKKQKVATGEENLWNIGKNRMVKLSEFKGKWYVNIREYYDAGGELRPGKKGIMLTMEQWQAFKGIIGEVEDAIKKNV